MKTALIEIKIRLWMLWAVLTKSKAMVVFPKKDNVIFLSNEGELDDVAQRLLDAYTAVKKICDESPG